MMYQDPILVDQRHYIGHRSQRRVAHSSDQELSHRRTHPLGIAASLADRPRQLESDPRAAQPAERIEMTGQSRVHHGRRLRQRVCQLMVIGNDQFQAQLRRCLRFLDTRDPAIDRDHHRRASLGQLPQRIAIEAVPFLESIGHVVANVSVQ